MIVPAQAHDALLADIRAARSETEKLHLWWFGQSGFLVQWQGRHLLFDPYLSDSLTRKYAATDKPHVRLTEIPIEARRLDMVDVITASHQHTDHLDGETLSALLAANRQATLVVPAALREFAAERLQVSASRLTPIDDGGRVDAAAFELHAVPAAHEIVERDDQGRCRFLGFVARFGPWTVYHAGDTVRYEGQVERLRPFAVDVALLPINGRLPERRVAGNLWGEEAAELARDIGARIVVPCHFEMFAFNTVAPDAFVAACQRLGQRFRVLRCGERLSLPSS